MIIIVGLLASEYTQQDNNQYTQHINKDIIMGSFSITHWLILLVVVVVVFCPWLEGLPYWRINLLED